MEKIVRSCAIDFLLRLNYGYFKFVPKMRCEYYVWNVVWRGTTGWWEYIMYRMRSTYADDNVTDRAQKCEVQRTSASEVSTVSKTPPVILYDEPL